MNLRTLIAHCDLLFLKSIEDVSSLQVVVADNPLGSIRPVARFEVRELPLTAEESAKNQKPKKVVVLS